MSFLAKRKEIIVEALRDGWVVTIYEDETVDLSRNEIVALHFLADGRATTPEGAPIRGMKKQRQILKLGVGRGRTRK